MSAIENVEWLNQNLLRAYPLHEDADLTPRLPDGSVATGLRVPTALLTDFSFTLPFDAATSVPCLTGIIHAVDGFTVEISVGTVVLTSRTARISDHTVNASYPVTGIGDYDDCAGWITFGDLARAAEEIPEGSYRFDPGQVPFEVSTLHLATRGVRSITAIGKYGLMTYAPLTGRVKLIAGSDMSVRTDVSGHAIWLQAESNTGYERTGACMCTTADDRRVRSVNGMTVDDVQIVGDPNFPCITVTTDGDRKTVKIGDACSVPCCGCNELNFVETAVATINRSIETLTGYAEALQARLAELQANEAATRASVDAYPSNKT